MKWLIAILIARYTGENMIDDNTSQYKVAEEKKAVVTSITAT